MPCVYAVRLLKKKQQKKKKCKPIHLPNKYSPEYGGQDYHAQYEPLQTQPVVYIVTCCTRLW